MSIEELLKLIAGGGIALVLFVAGQKQLFVYKWYVDELKEIIKKKDETIERQQDQIDNLITAVHSSANVIEKNS